MADVPPSPRPPAGARIAARLEIAAREAPSGGRAKWIVWALLGGIVVVIGVLQMLGVLPSPFADRIKEDLRRSGRIPAEAPSEKPAPAPAPAPPGMDQGTTK